MKSFKSFLILVLAAALPVLLSAQNSTVRKETRKGNREYKAQKYDRAEVNYLRALHQDSNAYRAQYNLGNTEGMQQFQQAVNDYQEALKLAPKNDDTRYNLSYAKKMLQQAQQQQQQQGGGQNQDNKDKNKDKNKDQNQQGNNGQDNQKDQQQQQNKQQQQQNQNQQQNQQDRQKQKQQKRQQQQKKQDAERLLEAVKNNEKNTMKENAKKVEVAAPRSIEKDW